jgi:hypothetical protein
LNADQPACLYCHRSSDLVPLLTLRYQQDDIFICPQHLPILIHKPELLAEYLPEAASFGSAAGHDHSGE